MRLIRVAHLFVFGLILGPGTAQAELITFDQMESAHGCDRTYWLGDGIFDGCGADHLSWFHTVIFDEPVSQINAATIRINFWDDDPDEQCLDFWPYTCIPWQPEGAAISIGSTNFLPTFDFDFDDLDLQISFDFEVAEIDSGWRSFDVPGFADLIDGGAVAVRVTGFSPLSLQDFKVNSSVLTIDYTPYAYNEVPEPSTFALFSLGLLALAFARHEHQAF